MQLIDFGILALATWRLSNLLVNENGPADMFERLRARVGILRNPLNPNERYADNQNSVIAQALLCVWCTSVWVGMAFALLWAVWPALSVLVALPLALSAISCWVDGKI